MALVRFPNSFAVPGNPDTLLAADILSGDLSLTVTTLPAGLSAWDEGEFTIKIDNEWIHIVSIGGTGNLVWQIGESANRGYEGSTAASHLANADIHFAVVETDFRRGVRQSPGSQLFMAQNFV